jgi:hypothetical protein
VLTALIMLGLIGWVHPAIANNSDDGTGTGAIVRPFDAGSSDWCGGVSGDFHWSPSLRNNMVIGVIFDRCGDLETSVTFTAYAGTSTVARTERLDGVQREFTTLLSAPVAIDRILITTCRVPVSGAGSCGPPQTFRRP